MTNSSGQAGNIEITTPYLTIAEGAEVSAATVGGLGGLITVKANILELLAGGRVRTTTSGKGKAGDINLYVQDRITLAGAGSGLFADTQTSSTGNGGNIFIDPQTFIIRDGARVSVDSQGSGKGGNIQIQAGTLTLDNGTISAETASTNGGDITLDIQELLVLSNESSITATAGTAQGAGNGGNIDITTPFVIAFADNNQIRANAFLGNGGNININTNFIFGVPDFLEISASSQLGLAGTVVISSTEFEPSRGLVELPENVADPNEQLAQNPCTQGRGSKFVITGRGGLPTSPSATLSSEATEVGFVEPAPMESEQARVQGTREVEEKTPNSQTIIPARGWIFKDNGEVVLVAYDTSKSGVQRHRHTPAQCSAP